MVAEAITPEVFVPIVTTTFADGLAVGFSSRYMYDLTATPLCTALTKVIGVPPNVTPVTVPGAASSLTPVFPTETATSNNLFGPVPGVCENVNELPLDTEAAEPLVVAAAVTVALDPVMIEAKVFTEMAPPLARDKAPHIVGFWVKVAVVVPVADKEAD